MQSQEWDDDGNDCMNESVRAYNSFEALEVTMDRTLELLTWCAEDGRLVCCNADVRKLWYVSLVEWCSPTEVRLTSAGLAYLYRAAEAEENADEGESVA